MSLERNRRRWFGFSILACALLSPVAVTGQVPEGLAGSQATATGLGKTTPQPLAKPPALAASRVAALEAEVARRGSLKLPIGEQVPVPELSPLKLDAKPPVGAAPPDVPGDPFVVEVSSPLAPGSAGLAAATVGEPSVAQTGGTVFYTGNWYAARTFGTANPGPADWSYIDPSAGMPDFCCDQDAIADRGRDMILWTRLSIGTRFILSESTDQGITFCSWELNPAQLGYTGSYDQPLMALSNNYLYVSANIFGPFHNVLLKISLDTLQDCPGSFNYTWWNVDAANGWGSLVQGATTTMYFGSHGGTNNSFTIWYQPENSGSLFNTPPIGIPAFTFENRNANCPVGGLNPCARGDSRVETGWVRQRAYQSIGEVGFMWNAREGGGFAWPWIDGVTVRQDNLTAVTGQPTVAYSNTAVQYPSVSPNARGDLGLTNYFMGGGFFPGAEFRVDDDYSLGLAYVVDLNDGNGSASAWGDYVRNRSFLPTQTGWTSASHAIVNGVVRPMLSIVSRQRDLPGINRHLYTP